MTDKLNALEIPVNTLFRASDLPLHPDLDVVLETLVTSGDIDRVAPGLYWRGSATRFGRISASARQIVTHLYGPRSGLGSAGLSAVNGLGLSTQVPGHESFAVPHPCGFERWGVRLVDRSHRAARAVERLSFVEVTILEALDDEDWWEYSPTRVYDRLAEVITRCGDEVDLARLERGAATEESATRAHLAGVLSRLSSPGAA